MANIGKPESISNPFSNIKIGSEEQRTQTVAKSKPQDSVGDQLNEIAGNKTNSGLKFVDKNTHNKLDKDSFLKLLTVQLSNQDPLNPVDQKQFAADMAQFASLEQLTNMNTKMDKLKENAPAEFKFYGASFIGKKVTTDGATVELSDKNPKPVFSFNMEKPSVNTKIIVYDQQGQAVSQIILDEKMPQGENRFVWDGKQLDGTQATYGKYTYSVHGTDESLGKFNAKTRVDGVVTGVAFEGNQTVLEVDGKKRVYLDDVRAFNSTERSAGLPGNAGAPAVKPTSTAMKEMLNSYNEAANGGGQ
jgi:flagellar basal-body rod modification protein FlgD